MVMTAAAIDNNAPNVDVSSIRLKKAKLAEYLKTSHDQNSHHHLHHHGAVVGHHNSHANSARHLIGDALRRRVEGIDHDMCKPGDEDTFYVADLGEVYRQHMRWKQQLPAVKPFFAVKCNPDPHVLRLLAELGAGFDCASKTEIEMVLGLGVSPDRIIYAQPCKTSSYVRFVRSVGVRRMTFDNADELHKVARLFPDAELVLRIATDDESSLCRLSMKFGAGLDTTDGLLATARELGLAVVGVSFHVGSGASDPAAFVRAVRDAGRVFAQAAARGFDMRVLDVGGGFSADSFDGMAAVLRSALDEHFPAHGGVSLMAEPGRFYVATAFTIACNVIARRAGEEYPDGGGGGMLYLNDGIYGNFSCIIFDHQNPDARVLRAGGAFMYDRPEARQRPAHAEAVEYSIWGPTCDGIDKISAGSRFGIQLDVGDWLYFENMGAYTMCSATKFNGFSDAHEVIYVCSEPGARALMRI